MWCHRTPLENTSGKWISWIKIIIIIIIFIIIIIIIIIILLLHTDGVTLLKLHSLACPEWEYVFNESLMEYHELHYTARTRFIKQLT